jgi:hypothetical protein
LFGVTSLNRFDLILAKPLAFDLAKPVKIVGNQADVTPVERFIVNLAALLQTIPIEKGTEFDVFFLLTNHCVCPPLEMFRAPYGLNGAGNTLDRDTP